MKEKHNLSGTERYRIWMQESGANATLEACVEKFAEEDSELWEALAVLQLDCPESVKEAAMEFVDVILMGKAALWALGFDDEDLIAEKMDITEVKYSPVLLNQLREQGNDNVFIEAKKLWNGQ